MSEKALAHLYLVLASILIAGSFFASQQLAGVIDSISLTLYRFILAVIILLPFILIKKKNGIKTVFKTLPRAMIIGLLYSLYFIGMFKALEDTSALNTGTLYTLVPLMTAIFCIFFFKEKIKLDELFIYILGIVSTCIVIFKADLNLFLSFTLNKGDIVFLIACVAMALYPIFLKLLHKKGDELLILVFCTLIAGIIWMFFTVKLLNIELQWYKIEASLFYYMLYLVIGTTVITLFLYQKATIVLGAKKTMAYVYINPPLVAIIMFLFERETISFGVFLGILLSFLATLILLKKS